VIQRHSRAECSCIGDPWRGYEPQWPKRCCGRPRGRRCSHVARARQRGAVLAIVLLLSAMLLVTSAAWFEASLAAARSAVNVRDYLQAFHAADSALTLCARGVIGSAGVGVIASQAAREPAQWKLETVFEAAAATPIAQLPGSVRAPQCVVEEWRIAGRPNARAYLLTARGFGKNRESQVWLQMQLVLDGNVVERHWRRVAARPF